MPVCFKICLSILAVAALLFSTPSLAQDDQVNIWASADVNADMMNVPTHPPLKVTPDKAELVKLEKPAGTIIIGNPEHLSVMAESPKTLVMVPGKPGATFLTVLDTRGETLMQRHVVVASPKQDYIRIRNSCANAGEGCQETRVYYCPDMCHEIAVAQEAKEAQQPQDLGTPGGDPFGGPPPSEPGTIE